VFESLRRRLFAFVPCAQLTRRKVIIYHHLCACASSPHVLSSFFTSRVPDPSDSNASIRIYEYIGSLFDSHTTLMSPRETKLQDAVFPSDVVEHIIGCLGTNESLEPLVPLLRVCKQWRVSLSDTLMIEDNLRLTGKSGHSASSSVSQTPVLLR
jgi:hypothetical protein